MRQIFSFSPKTLSESTSVLNNPYRGFYHMIRYTLTDSGQHTDTSAIREYGLSLVLLEINLRNYRTGAISGTALAQLEDILNAWSQSDAQIMLRFLYDWDGIAKVTEPKSLSTVLTHMDQVSEIVNHYEASVYLMQGIFIGNWGEMHGSYFTDAQSVKALTAHLHEVIAPSIFLSVRTPAQWRMITGLDKIPARVPVYSSIADRLGLYNDGMLGSQSDLGTYESTPGARQEELAFQNRLCQSVPNGGEVVYDTPYNVLPAAVSYFKTIHVSYLNADYDQTVLEKWHQTVWEGQDTFFGCDGLTYIKAHLGYRYTVRRFTIRDIGFLQPRLQLCVTVENTGFGNTLKPFEGAFLFQNTATEAIIRLPLPFDFRTFKSGQTITLKADLSGKALPTGSYSLFFSVTDPATGRQIALANTEYREGKGLPLGQIVDKTGRDNHLRAAKIHALFFRPK